MRYFGNLQAVNNEQLIWLCRNSQIAIHDSSVWYSYL